MSVFSRRHNRGAALAALADVQDVTRVLRPAGQVIVYPEHFPEGAHLVLSGRLLLEPEGGTSLAHRGPCTVEVGDDPLLLPPLDELGEPAHVRLTTESEVELLFLPKSLVETHAGVRRLVEDVAPERHSLR